MGKIKSSAKDIISAIFSRYGKTYPDIFQKLQAHEDEIRKIYPRRSLSVDDCKHILNKYKILFPMGLGELQMEVVSECLLLLFNWEKCKVIYHIESVINNNIKNEYVNSDIFNSFPYPCIYFDYNFKDDENYGVFITRYKHIDNMYLQKRFILGFIQKYPDNNIWCIEPIVFNIKEGASVIDSIEETMHNFISLKKNKVWYIKKLSTHSCTIIKILSAIIETFKLENNYSQSSSSENKTPQESNEFDVKIEIHNKINLNIVKDNFLIKENPENDSKSHRKSSKKSPHPRRAHIRNILVKDKDGNVVGVKTIQISSTYIHKEEVKPLSIKTIV